MVVVSLVGCHVFRKFSIPVFCVKDARYKSRILMGHPRMELLSLALIESPSRISRLMGPSNAVP